MVFCSIATCVYLLQLTEMVFCSIVACVHLREYTVPSIRQIGFSTISITQCTLQQQHNYIFQYDYISSNIVVVFLGGKMGSVSLDDDVSEESASMVEVQFTHTCPFVHLILFLFNLVITFVFSYCVKPVSKGFLPFLYFGSKHSLITYRYSVRYLPVFIHH